MYSNDMSERARATHCGNGHPMQGDGSNVGTYNHKRGGKVYQVRYCKTCSVLRVHLWRQRKKFSTQKV